MAAEAYRPGQRLNLYHEMLHTIYGPTQNYAKSKFEVLSHLSEVCGISGKYIVKTQDFDRALRFIPKIFGWACALLYSVSPQQNNIEEVVLRKFPGCCPYCLKEPCLCWSGNKPTLDSDRLEQKFYPFATGHKRGVLDFELMFVRIYGEAWQSPPNGQKPISYAYVRMIEELAELSEAVRFYHLYPENFENELADFIAWWFALAVLIRREHSKDDISLDTLLWSSYPGHCRDCESAPCFCQQGPVRELMSKPAPGQAHLTDALTGLRNQGAYKKDLSDLASGRLALPGPIACVRADVDNFKNVNDTIGHNAGDAALEHVARILRSKARTRDRIYRISGDEFGVISPDFTEEECAGLMKRVLSALKEQPIKWTKEDGEVVEFKLGLSIGVAECGLQAEIAQAFEHADKASYASKAAGKGRVTRFTEVPPE
ncbi:diguanylate cyclase [Methylobacterium sp. WL12]|uniref:diguanylate cyclase domain-containing protein n=1 Tax=Methylobacterium sp. WL12 TaxID=2603890 RepID=UPI0011CBC720|nr:diguanylate cyclase [Methylobacterium sp. WL12]TXM66633.1 diguanylate cyclase [Methylobacterium sp. WL12]